MDSLPRWATREALAEKTYSPEGLYTMAPQMREFPTDTSLAKTWKGGPTGEEKGFCSLNKCLLSNVPGRLLRAEWIGTIRRETLQDQTLPKRQQRVWARLRSLGGWGCYQLDWAGGKILSGWHPWDIHGGASVRPSDVQVWGSGRGSGWNFMIMEEE